MDVSHVAKLANITVDAEKGKKLQSQFTSTLELVNEINSVDSSNLPPTYQVTGQKNVSREDVIQKDRIIPQNEVLSLAANSQNGYIVVPSIFNAN